MKRNTLITLLAAAGLASSASAQTLINDTFAGGNISGWYSAGVTGSSVSAFNAGGGNEYLSINSNAVATSGNHAFKAFTGTTLAIGETLTLTLNVATLASQPNANNSVGVALFNTTSSFAADQTAANVWAAGSQGYRFFLSTGTNTASTLGWTNLGAINTPWAGGGNVAGTTTTGGTLAAGTLVTFDIARVGAAELQLTVTNGATTLYSSISSTAGTTPEYFTFNTLAVGYLTTSGANRNIRLDSVQLSVVPEPSTYAAIAGGLVLAVVAWRRRRS